MESDSGGHPASDTFGMGHELCPLGDWLLSQSPRARR